MTALTKAWSALSLAVGASVLLLGCPGKVGDASGGSGRPPALAAPAILTQPADATTIAGTTASFSVIASGSSLRYQWSKNGAPIAGATGASYQTATLTKGDSGTAFTVTLANDLGQVTSRPAKLTVNPATQLAIVTQPASQTVTTGSTATFSVVAESTAPITYQWSRNGAAIPGATSWWYATPPATAGDAGAAYTVALTSGDADATSAGATLSLDDDLDDLMPLVSGKSWSSSTPMGTHYQSRHVTTDADRSKLADATVQPPLALTGIDSGALSGDQWSARTVKLFPHGAPVPADVNQHGIGDCNGLTAMANLAYQAPAFVKGLITDHGDGTFSVAMFDPQGQRIEVRVDSQFVTDQGGGIVQVTAKDGNADWATVLEKAIMKYIEVYATEGSIGGIGAENVTPLFTGVGNSFAVSPGALAAADMTRIVEESLARGKFISCGFNQTLSVGLIQTVTGHGYACFWPSNAATMFSMRNPWGVNPLVAGGYDSSADGLVDIPSATTPTDWSKVIDLRITDPGLAGSAGRSTPYLPTAAQTWMAEIRIDPRLLRSGE